MKIGEVWKGPTVTMCGGNVVSLYNTTTEMISIEDIALTLSKICRYGGRCNKFYSVAEHSVHVSKHVSRKYALAGLLHDAGEAYLIDVPKPLQIIFQGYNKLEERILSIIFEKFGIDSRIPRQVLEADKYIAMCEYKRLVNRAALVCDDGNDLSNADATFPFKWWPPPVAYAKFMDRFRELTLRAK